MEHHGLAEAVLQHQGLGIIEQDFVGRATEIRKGPYQRLVQMLGIQAQEGPGMGATGKPQGHGGKVDLARHPADLGHDLAPVHLRLTPGAGLETDRRPRGAQYPLRAYILDKHAVGPAIALRQNLPPDHHGVPHAGGQ